MTRNGTGDLATGDSKVVMTSNKIAVTSCSKCQLNNAYSPLTLDAGPLALSANVRHPDSHNLNKKLSAESGSSHNQSNVRNESNPERFPTQLEKASTPVVPNVSKSDLYLTKHKKLYQASATPLLSLQQEPHGVQIKQTTQQNFFNIPSTGKTNTGLGSFPEKTDAVKTAGAYVYDGGGTEKPDSNSPKHSRLDSTNTMSSIGHSSRDKEAPNRTCNVNLLPRLQEQIGPPIYDFTALALSSQAPDKQSLESSSLKLPPSHETSEKTMGVPKNVSNSNTATTAARLEEMPLLSCKDSPIIKKTSSKRFIHATLCYKSKIRTYKMIVVSVCYLSLILLVLAVRKISRLRSSVEQPQGLDLLKAEEESMFSGHYYTPREKRSAGGGSRIKRVGNTSVCVPLYDENHNEIYIMSYDTFKSGGLIVHVIIGMYTFAAIAAICDIYFVPSLEHICEDLKLEADVAGATFMAAASSAPEFCTSVIGIFVQETDVGLGAIVGSSIFNLLAIIGLCGIFAGMHVQLSWYPLSRDSIFYTVAVFEMLAFMYDTLIHWYEALVMMMTYLLYILVMVFNKKIEEYMTATESPPASRTSSLLKEIHKTHSARLEIIRARSHSRVSAHVHMMNESRLKQLAMAGPHQDQVSYDLPLVNKESSMSHRTNLEVEGSEASVKKVEGTPADPKKVATVVEEPIIVNITPPNTLVDEEETESAVAEYENPLDYPEGFVARLYWIIVLPMTMLHAYTIPDSRIQNSWQSKYYMIPFTLSVVYLAIYSYIMVWAMSVAAWGLNIPVTITGLTVLAAGTSVPDCLSSIFVARAGQGDMAVSNAIGSNVFDILLCLGVPWFFMGIVENGLTINSEGMFIAGMTLLVTIIYLVVSLNLWKWTLTPWYGVLTLSVYIVIMAFCCLVELNILFKVHEIDPC